MFQVSAKKTVAMCVLHRSETTSQQLCCTPFQTREGTTQHRLFWFFWYDAKIKCFWGR